MSEAKRCYMTKGAEAKSGEEYRPRTETRRSDKHQSNVNDTKPKQSERYQRERYQRERCTHARPLSCGGEMWLDCVV